MDKKVFLIDKEENRTFDLGDVVLITDTYEECDFTAHCIKKIESLKRNGSIQFEFVFAVDQSSENDISYIVGDDRSDSIYHFDKVIGNILM